MKLFWLCNMIPGEIKRSITGKAGSGLWVDHVLSGLRGQEHQLHILCPGEETRGEVDEKLSFAVFPGGAAHVYRPELEAFFRKELDSRKPDVIHIWGTEYAHTLAMVNACEAAGCLDRVVISIQGLCSVYSGHYAEGVPSRIQHSFTFRDLLRWDNIACQRKTFARRGALEVEALKKVHNVMGRTPWDKACTYAINPGAKYYFCNETLRETFYEGNWEPENSVPHRIFASSCAYPVKGFHYLLEAARMLKDEYPDLTIAVTGNSFLKLSLAGRIRESSYQRYLAALARKYGMEDSLEFTGMLSPEEMKEQFLKANVFVLPSTIENSPNSLGEAMLLGTPCVASDVGGVSTLMRHEEEGYVYQSTAAYMLAHFIREVFKDEHRARKMGEAARRHAGITHDPQKNLRDLTDIYKQIARCGEV